MEINKIYCGDVLEVLKTFPDESVDCIITSPPYWNLRNYNVEEQIGLEPTLEEYLDRLFAVMKELKRVLKKTGVIFWNHGDSYGGGGNPNDRKLAKGLKIPSIKDTSVPPKCLALQNYRFILRCVDELGLTLRDVIIWAKKVWIAKENKTVGNAMPSSVRDRCTFTYEPIFMLVKDKKYYFDQHILRVPYTQPLNRWGGDKLIAKNKSEWDEDTGQQTYRDRDMRPNPMGANRPNVWQINTEPTELPHFACFPTELVKWLILAGCPQWICKKCGKARERIIEEEHRPNKPTASPFAKTNQDLTGKINRASFYKDYRHKEFIGWTDCGCNAGWKPGIVLDPFMGAGTTAVVAQRLGRNWVGIELNPEYVEMAYKRIKKELGLFNYLEEYKNVEWNQ